MDITSNLKKDYKRVYRVLKKQDVKNLNPKTLYQAVLEASGHRDLKLSKKFTIYGAMIDLARGAVFKTDYLKTVILKLALLGVNEVWLYLEDNFDLKIPYFGYLRGRYTLDDLKDLDNYANQLGVTLVLSVQTLGHLSQFLHWPVNGSYQDQEAVLLVESEKTYLLIDEILRFAKKALKTTKIHLGMDEAYNLGYGNYLKKFGLKRQSDIFLTHLKKVYELALSHGFTEVMIWSDMIFQVANGHQGYYSMTTNFNQNIISQIPAGIKLVYWDYYNEYYRNVDYMFKKHRELSDQVVLATGIWSWRHPYIDFLKVNRTVPIHLEAAKNNGVDEVVVTMWNDDGAYVDFESVYLGMLYTSSNVYEVKADHVKVYDLLFGKKAHYKMLQKTLINNSPLNPIAILYDDLLLGINANNEEAKDQEILIKTLEYFEGLKRIKGENEYNLLLKILKLKLSLRIDFKSFHEANKRFNPLINDLKELQALMVKYLAAFRKRWLKSYLPYGLEIHEIRLGGQIARIDSIIERIKSRQRFIELEEVASSYQPLSNNWDELASSYHRF